MRLAKRYPKLMLVGTGIAFVVSGIDCLENKLLFIAVSSFVVGTINFAACLLVTKKPFQVKIFLLLVNALFAFLSAYVYFTAGRNYIQYGWMAVGFISLAAISKAYMKKEREKNPDVK